MSHPCRAVAGLAAGTNISCGTCRRTCAPHQHSGLSLPHSGGVALCGHQVVKVVQDVVPPAGSSRMCFGEKNAKALKPHQRRNVPRDSTRAGASAALGVVVMERPSTFAACRGVEQTAHDESAQGSTVAHTSPTQQRRGSPVQQLALLRARQVLPELHSKEEGHSRIK